MSEHDEVGATATAYTDAGGEPSVNTLKLLITSAIFLSALLSVLAPIIIIHKSESYFSVGNMMASGVLLAAALTHQLADATNTLNGALGGDGGEEDGDDDDNETYPWAMLICGLTFIAFLILEESVHLLLGESSHGHDSDDGGINLLLGAHSHDHKDHGAAESGRHDHSHGHGHSHDHGRPASQSIPEEKTPLVGSNADRKREYGRRSSCSASLRGGIGANGSGGPSPDNGSSSRRSFRTYSKVGKSVNFSDAFDTLELQELHGEDVEDEKSVRKSGRSHRHRHRGETSILASIMDGSILTEDYNRLHSVHHHHDDHISQHLHGSTLASLMLFLALSLHSILEGVAIGIVPRAEMVVSTSAAILTHKAFAGYALGSTLITAESLDTRKHLYLGIMFSMTTPLGVLLGMALLDDFNGDSFAVGVVQAMVAGTFLYVSIVEVGTKELLVCRHGEEENVTGSVKRTEFLKLFAFLMGFLLMSGLAAFV